jgi:hypothetical protein
MLADGNVEPSLAINTCCPMLVPKPDGGSPRVVVDYTPLNKISDPIRYNAPLISDVVATAVRHKFFTKLDLKDAFFHILLEPDTKHLTAFSTPWGDYEFHVMPQGWCNAPAHWQRYIAWALQQWWLTDLLAYADDIIIFSNNANSLHAISRGVRARLGKLRLRINEAKSVTGVTTVRLLGITITNGTHSLRVPVERIREWPEPRNKKKLQEFLGFANSMRPYVPNLSQLCEPMDKLVGNAPWQWNKPLSQSFQRLKAALEKSLTLRRHTANTPIDLYTDASLVGAGVVLKEKGWPIAVCSRKFTSAEKNYDTWERELLAVIWSLEALIMYTGDASRITIHTDHANSVKHLAPSITKRRRNRWIEFLNQFPLDWVWIPGKDHIADALSRIHE